MEGAVRVEHRPPGEAGAERLALARALLRRLEGRGAAPEPDPPPGAGVLAVVEPLAGLFPGRGLRRGATVAVPDGPAATSLLLILLAQASGAGAWIGVVGRPELGLVAAAEAGLRLERVALVPRPGADLVAVTAALLDGLDVVVVAGAQRAGVRAADRQRLAARARQRGAVLVPLGSWPGADAELACTSVHWEGLGAGAGRLRSRRASVRLRGRGLPPAGRSAELLLPGVDGATAGGVDVAGGAATGGAAAVAGGAAAVAGGAAAVGGRAVGGGLRALPVRAAGSPAVRVREAG
ncbi:MAG: hypothetical protein ACT4RN_12035 [Pseudonocardia sp.]